MRSIFFTNQTQNNAVILLGDDIARIFISNYQRRGEAIYQRVEYPRAEQSERIFRGNFSTFISFTASRNFASTIDLHSYLSSLAESVAGVGYTKEYEQTFSGAILRYVHNAIVIPGEPRVAGRHAWIPFTIEGGKMSNQAPL